MFSDVAFVTALVKQRIAKDHLDALKVAQDAYLDEGPWRVVGELHSDCKVRLYRLKLTKVPIFMSAVLGDAYGCLHEALDHIAWCLGPAETDGASNTYTAFPLNVRNPADSPSGAASWARMTFGMSPAAVEFLDSFQPYRARDESTHGDARITETRRHLGALGYLSNRDKHRHLTPLNPVVPKVVATYKSGEIEEVEFTDSPLVDNSIISASRFANRFRDAKTDLELGVASYVSLHPRAYPPKFPQEFQVGLDENVLTHVGSIGNAVGHVIEAANAIKDEIAHPSRHWANIGWP